MKSINFQEFERIVDNLRSKLCGAQLQEVFHFERGLVLGFYLRRPMWLLIELTAKPVILLFDKTKPPIAKSPKPKPLTLFINSHFKNKYLKTVCYEAGWGRRLILDFSIQPEGESKVQDSNLFCDLILIPNNPNFIARAMDKKISWNKVKDFSQLNQDRYSTQGDFTADEFRSPEVILEEWLDSGLFSSYAKSGDGNASHNQVKVKDDKEFWFEKNQKDIAKKKMAIEKIKESVISNQEKNYYEVGEFLKTHSLELLPKEWNSFIDFSKSKSWNRENIFQKAKNVQKKREGAEERIHILEKEISLLECQTYEDYLQKKKHNISKLSSKEMSLRKLDISQQAIAYMGKNASENMKLLKESQSWDLWFHFRDIPSSFVIVRKNKNYSLSQVELIKVIDWFVKESFRNKKTSIVTDMDVIYTECRYVKPIKGDKLGRVNYSQERSFRWKISKNQ
ncbi:MAG: DUF814 domain-containing protein [Bdellovibrionaceae bacterium]|nr:DUF814 domain-containing protein [Pseudobdellovibrionaceae bacterium]